MQVTRLHSSRILVTVREYACRMAVYFGVDLDWKLIKIGCSRNPPARGRDLNIALLVVTEGDFEVEAMWHEHFAHLRTRRPSRRRRDTRQRPWLADAPMRSNGDTEWFRPAPELWAAMQAIPNAHHELHRPVPDGPPRPKWERHDREVEAFYDRLDARWEQAKRRPMPRGLPRLSSPDQVRIGYAEALEAVVSACHLVDLRLRTPGENLDRVATAARQLERYAAILAHLAEHEPAVSPP